MDRSLHFNEKVLNGKEMNGSVYFLYKKKKKIQIVCGSVQQIWLPADFYDRSFVV